jgi:membrane-bound ClpP family serine protease
MRIITPILFLGTPARALAVTLLLAVLVAGSVRAQEAQEAGLVVPIAVPITAETSKNLQTAVHGQLKRFEAEREAGAKGRTFYLICDFNPDNKTSNSDDFGACLKLAEALRDLQTKKGVRTVAFVHGTVSRHSVLPVLACEKMVMSVDAKIGKVVDQGDLPDGVRQTAYETMAQKSYPLAIIRKMFDKDVAIVKVKQGNSESYHSAKEKPGGEPVRDLGSGSTALYTREQAKEFGLCEQITCNTLGEVLTAYRLPPRTSLLPTPDRVIAWRIVASGTLNGELHEKVKRRVRQALGQKANLIILQLECGDGESQAAYELALFLTELNKERADNPVETVAFVTNQARNTAAFLAFACDRIFMQRETKQGEVVTQPGAFLGDFERFLKDRPSMEATIRRNLAEIAGRRYYPPVIAEGLLSRDLCIHDVESTKGASERRFLSQEQLDADLKGKDPRWKSLDVVKKSGSYLTLSAEQAFKLHIADAVVGNLEDVYGMEGLTPSEVHVAEADWLDSLADFLRDPWTSVVLVMLGVTCLILEMKMPGVTVPGVIAAVCFVLFFWSHSQLNGQITMLALMLFVLGLILIGLEVFVLPGFGFAGVTGILLVVGSLGLVAYGHWPRTNEELIGFGNKVGPFALGILGAIAGALALARYLPHIPYANRLILTPPGEEGEPGSESSHVAGPDLSGLLGAIGVAATPLRPAGKAQFGDDFLDVLAEGSYVVPGTRVQVIEIEGNRIVVKEV